MTVAEKPTWGHIVSTATDEVWFEDFLRSFIGAESASLPPSSLQIGDTQAEWIQPTPGKVFISATGGSPADKLFARSILREALVGHGLEPIQFTFEWDHSDRQLIKEATWEDIEAKAKRLIQTGKVQILRNSANIIVGHVEGDHGDYQTEIQREDPNSQAISLWDCECEWDQFAWQRTRKWKKYEGRVCSHALATYWLAQTLPLDEETEPGGGGGEGPMPPGAPGAGGMVPPGVSPGLTGYPVPSYDPSGYGGGGPYPMPSSGAPAPGQAPEPPSLLPEYPGDPSLMPAMNPVSVPGQKPAGPLNPIQWPGGTFSHRLADQQYVNGQMVMNTKEDVGTTVGLNAGEPKTIPAKSIGEVLGTDPTTGMVNVYFAGPQANAGPLQPHGVTGWFFPGELTPSNVQPPGPAIKRR